MSRFFETIRIEGGRAHHLEYHQRRMERTVKEVFGKRKTPLLEEHLYQLPKELARCRIEYTTVIEKVEFIPYQKKIPKSFQMIESDMEYPYKSCDRTNIDELNKIKNGADEIIICRNGKLRDTSMANLALKIDGKWLTPDWPLLPGTTRERLLKEGLIEMSPLQLTDIQTADSLAVMNAMVGFLEIPDFVIRK